MRVSTVSMKMAASLAALTVATVGTLYLAAPQFGSRMADRAGGEGERRTALLERHSETKDALGGKLFPPADKSIYERLSNEDGRTVASEPPAPPAAQVAQGRLEERIENALRSQQPAADAPATTEDVFDMSGPVSKPLAVLPSDLQGYANAPRPDIAKRLAQEGVVGLGGATDKTDLAGAHGNVHYYTDADGRFQIQQPEEQNRDRFEPPAPNPVKQVAAEPVSTFSIDVDTASYAFARRAINAGHLPPKEAVRVEEMVNYFPYAYPRPEAADAPFQPSVTVSPAPWKPANKLVHIGIKGYELVPTERPRANLVFLIDISGSMAPMDRLPLVKNAFRLMLDTLQPDDTVGIVTYASGSGIALEPTKVSDRAKILAALDALGAGGSTAGAQGLADAYRLAEAHYDKAGVNRIILATDGDFNVGISDQGELKGFIERKREAGIFLSILGVGQGNYNDALTQALAQNGNGTAAYVDTLNEARKVLVEEASSTLFTIARDVKIQVEFNPAQVAEYRLIGYETRALAREDFNNDKVDGGDVGSGHSVTAIYEITPKGAPKLVDDLRYASEQPAGQGGPGEYGFLKLRYKLPKQEASKLITLAITPALERSDIAAAPEDVRFSVAVAGFGQLLRGLPYLGTYNYDDVLALAQGARGADPYGYRSEFLNLVRLAKSARP
jgi:Ca-activated chloride channel family protein